MPDAPSPELVAAASDLLAHARLTNVRPIKIVAELATGVPQPVGDAEYLTTVAYAHGPGRYSNKAEFTLTLKGAESEAVASISIDLVVDWEVEPDFTPTEEAADFVAATTGYFAAFPYARELFQSLTTRLELEPIVLGLLTRDTLKPTGIGRLAGFGSHAREEADS
ncbi:MAG: hypothetical protein AB7L13_01625 [Acidimicrobiia bacterium]